VVYTPESGECGFSSETRGDYQNPEIGEASGVRQSPENEGSQLIDTLAGRVRKCGWPLEKQKSGHSERTLDYQVLDCKIHIVLS